MKKQKKRKKKKGKKKKTRNWMTVINNPKSINTPDCFFSFLKKNKIKLIAFGSQLKLKLKLK